MNEILTNEELNVLNDTLEEERNESSKLMEELENNTEYDLEDEEDIFMPKDGDTKGIDLYDAAIGKITEDEDIEAATKAISDKFKLPLEDIKNLIDLGKRYRNKEEFKIYDELPERVKAVIDLQIAQAGYAKNEARHMRKLFSELFMEEFTTEMIDKYIDKEYIDMNKSIEATLGTVTNLTDMYAGHIRYLMEVELKKKAEAAKTPEAREIYLRCSNAFSDSYNYTKMLNLLKTDGKARRKLYKDNFKFDRFCRDFDYKNKDTKYSIRNVAQMYDAMHNHLKDLHLTDADIKAFVILFTKTATNMDMSRVENSTYAYYSIFNIVNLGFDTKKGKFSLAVENNIKKVFNAIWEITGDTRVFEVEDHIDWVEDEPTAEELKSFEDFLNEDTEDEEETINE